MESTSSTSVLTEESAVETTVPENITLTLRKPNSETDTANDKKVKFAEDTVDNENLNRKKSKCCCIFEKQKLFGESSSEDEADDDECPDHCHGRKKYHKKPPSHSDQDKDKDKDQPVET